MFAPLVARTSLGPIHIGVVRCRIVYNVLQFFKKVCTIFSLSTCIILILPIHWVVVFAFSSHPPPSHSLPGCHALPWLHNIAKNPCRIKSVISGGTSTTEQDRQRDILDSMDQHLSQCDPSICQALDNNRVAESMQSSSQ